MRLKLSNLKQLNLSLVFSTAFAVKALSTRVTIADAVILSVILLYPLLKGIIQYKFPKRVDLYLELEQKSKTIDELLKRVEDLEMDMTAIKLGSSRGR